MSEHDQAPGLLNLSFLEGLHADYARDPSSVSQEWRDYFDRLSDGNRARKQSQFGPSFRPSSLFNPPIEPRQAGEASGDDAKVAALQERVDMLIRCYRVRGHVIAHLDPLEQPQQQPPELDPAFYEFEEADLERRFSCDTLGEGEPLPLREIINRLRNTYCRFIGVQFMHIDELSVRQWLQERMEHTQNRLALGREEQIRILMRLIDAVSFEEFIRKKFLGAKSFSLEGCESLIPLLDLAIEKAGEQQIDEIVLAMAHRGRLNVLANVIGKSPRDIFREFEDADPQLNLGRGDVKHHLGYSNDWKTAAGRTVHLSLCFNPSHVEFVNPVAIGRMRAKQDRAGDANRERGMVLLIHGDAAFAAEGVVQETLNLSQLPGYTVGGTLHVVVNNQIGFTTSPSEGRSSIYATDVAKMLQSPIFHVNGEDPEAVAQVVSLAMDFRHQFKRDVVIDMYGYRRLGHNEGDEPSFTQPGLYRAIGKRKSVREGYLEHLLALKGLTREEADQIAEQRRKHLEEELSAARDEAIAPPPDELRGLWKGYLGGPESHAPESETAVDRKNLSALLEALTQLPQDFHPHPKIARGIKVRLEMARGERPLDWSAAELLALATLATEGFRIRLSGQDTERGTFSQRHAVLHDYEDGHTYVPLQHVLQSSRRREEAEIRMQTPPDPPPHVGGYAAHSRSAQAPVEIYNSPLSELAALGFEYGYSLDCPEGLVLWEAQFGDFVNAAQVIIDQFIASAEDKWRRLSGIVLLLPHGFEGMGPEHSSARLERFLQLAAEDNIQIVYPTTPAQYFHCLRRQMLRRWRKPLVVMTPKSLLRHENAVSSLDELAEGAFQRILPDTQNRPPNPVKRVLLCSGKIYYDLRKQRDELKRDDVAILRLEQPYPLRNEVLQSALARYPDKTPVVWVQEEPENMGAWHYLRVRFGEKLFQRMPFSGVCRPASASPATGSMGAHKEEQRKILARAFGGN